MNAQGKIKARMSDNVLERDDWTVWELTLTDGRVASFAAVEHEASGAYGAPAFAGMSVHSLAEWTRYDGAGIHPEGYCELMIEGSWESFVAADDVEHEVKRNKHACRGCGSALDPGNLLLADGCPCNTPRGVNHGLVPRETCTCAECDPGQSGASRASRPPEGATCRVCKGEIPVEDRGQSLVDVCMPCLSRVHDAGSEEDLARRDALARVERPLVFFHDGCITHDGWMAALLAKIRWPDAEMVPLQYGCLDKYAIPSTFVWGFESEGRLREFRIDGRHVLMVDFSLPREAMEALARSARANGGSFLCLDHHKSAAQSLAGLDFCVFDMERSGAGLALDYFFPGSRERLVEMSSGTYAPRVHGRDAVPDQSKTWAEGGPKGVAPTWLASLAILIEDYDLWRFRDPLTRAVGIFLETIPKDPATPLAESPWMSLPSIADMAERGRVLLAYRAGLVESIARNAYRVEIYLPDGARGWILAVNSPLFKNEVADVLLRRDPEALARCRRPEEIPEAPGPLLACLTWYRHEDGFVLCSLRSAPGGMDCSAYAQSRGGGGHARSAGWRVALADQEGLGFVHFVDPSLKRGGPVA